MYNCENSSLWKRLWIDICRIQRRIDISHFAWLPASIDLHWNDVYELRISFTMIYIMAKAKCVRNIHTYAYVETVAEINRKYRKRTRHFLYFVLYYIYIYVYLYNPINFQEVGFIHARFQSHSSKPIHTKYRRALFLYNH